LIKHIKILARKLSFRAGGLALGHDTETSLGASKTWTLIDRKEDVHFEEKSS
jgi:hypothetical protein